MTLNNEGTRHPSRGVSMVSSVLALCATALVTATVSRSLTAQAPAPERCAAPATQAVPAQGSSIDHSVVESLPRDLEDESVGASIGLHRPHFP